MKQLFNSPLGSVLKAFITAILTLVVANNGFENLDIKKTLYAALFSLVPMAINWLNPNDTRYGKGSTPATNESN